MRTQIGTTVSPRTREQIDELLPQFGTISEVLAIAIDRLYQKEGRKTMQGFWAP